MEAPSSNTRPIANAGINQSVNTGDTVILDGSQSSDADGDDLSYSWIIDSKPEGSGAVLINEMLDSPTFVPDLEGTYSFQLVVNDGTVNSFSDTVMVSATMDGSSTTSGTSDVINNPMVTVTGTVMDTNGNPLSGVSVYVAGMETTTDAGGIYVFDEVPTVNTGVISNTTTNDALQVTIAAPEGYLGATVMVTPESQQISSGDPSVLNGGQTNPNTNFIDGYIASAGTAVLPRLNGTVHGVLENTINGTSLVGVEVCLDITESSIISLFVSSSVNTSVVSYATEEYCATTVEGGVFDIANLPSDFELSYNIADWRLANGQAATVLVQDTVVTNVGTLLVTPIISADQIAPMVASVLEGFNSNTNTTTRMMLLDDARTSFTLIFSEIMNDNEVADSVNVYVAGMKVAATVVLNGGQLAVTLSNPLMDGQEVDVHLVNADFRDVAGNFLALNPNIGYDESSTNVTTLVKLQAFKDLNLAAPSVATVEAVFNTDTNITNLSFTPSGANSYWITITDENAVADDIINVSTTSNVAVLTGNDSSTIKVEAENENVDIELTLTERALGDVITITPLDDLGYAGTPTTVTLVE